MEAKFQAFSEKRQHIISNLHAYKEQLDKAKKELIEFVIKRVDILSLKQDILGEYKNNNAFFKRLKTCQSITLKHRFSVFNALNSKAKLNAKEQGILQSFGSLHLIENAFNLTKEEKDFIVFLNKACHRFVRDCQNLFEVFKKEYVFISMVAMDMLKYSYDKERIYYSDLLGLKSFYFHTHNQHYRTTLFIQKAF
ncbi:hypothetical protein HCW_01195 [Helicobacter cetorum MIT 00-7128]|uniref:Uncharacterized protein n=2 Tax=Helicobacter cetorum TaxID=138563 RepID=I0EKR1_HELC0|nr:hypothetical protein HCW_01195 [Helicobacter cetorum MIT 00-7128]